MSAEEDFSASLFAGALGLMRSSWRRARRCLCCPPRRDPRSPSAPRRRGRRKVFGMVAIFLLVGQKLVKSVAPARRPLALAAGFALLGGISFCLRRRARLERRVHRRGGSRAGLALRHAAVPRGSLTPHSPTFSQTRLPSRGSGGASPV
jgi:hypothetical protein